MTAHQKWRHRLVITLACVSTFVAVSSFVISPTRRQGSNQHRVLLQSRRPSLFIPAASSLSSTGVVSIPDEYRLWKDAVPDVQVVDSMPEPLSARGALTKNYYLLRHGQSTANVDEVISSDRASLAYTNKHGLTALGYQQGRDAATRLVDLLEESPSAAAAGDTIVFVSSPFCRARQTAQACLDGLLSDNALRDRCRDAGWNIIPHVYYHDLLLERSFGRLDNEAIYTYAYVWPLDKMNVTHTAFNVESVAAVCTRLQRLILDLEQTTLFGTNVHVVCVSHADVLQIAQLYAAGVANVGEFSSYRFANGEVRRMNVGVGEQSLPVPDPLPAPQRGTGV